MTSRLALFFCPFLLISCQQAPAPTSSGPDQNAQISMSTSDTSSSRLKTPALISASSAKPQGGVLTWYTHAGADLLYRQAKYQAAMDMCNQAIRDITREKSAKAPELAAPLIDLATIYMRLAKYDDAKRVMDQAEGVLDKSKPDQALLLGRLGINKGWRLYTLGQTDAATKVFENARELLEKNQSAAQPGPAATAAAVDLAELINNLGIMYEDLGDREEDPDQIDKGRRYLLEGWMMRKRLTGEESPETAESLNNLGMHLIFNANNPSEMKLGLDTLKQSVELAKKVYGENHPETAMAHAALAMALYMLDQLRDSEREVRLAMPITQKFLGDSHPDRAFELMTLGRIMLQRDQFSGAEKNFAEALVIDEQVYGKNHPNLIPTLKMLKVAYDELGDSVKSLETQKRIEKLSGRDM